jgi:hypothetical protein
MAAKGQELSKGLKNKEYRRMVKGVEMYKKCTSNITIALMGAACLFTIFVLGMNGYHLLSQRFFLSRTRTDVIKEINFEEVTVNKVRYFLYRNSTEGASDISSSSNYFIVPNVTETCEGQGYQLWD